MLQGSTLLIALTLTVPALARGDDDVERALAQWRTRHGQAWQVVRDDAGRLGRLLYGGSAQGSFVPLQDEEYFRLADEQLVETAEIHGVEPATLVRDRCTFLPLGLAGSSDKLSVEYHQEVAGVPVVGAFVNVLFDRRGRMLSLDSSALPDLAGFDVTPALSAGQGAALAAAAFRAETGSAVVRQGVPELVLWPTEPGTGRRAARLTWSVETVGQEQDSVPRAFEYGIDARSGAVVVRRQLVHHFDVTGTIKSLATPGDRPDVAGNPEAEELMRHMDVVTSGGNTTTEADGSFRIVGASAPLSVTVRYEGTFASVVNAAGGNHVFNGVAMNDAGDEFVMNPVADEFTTAQANCFNWINRLRDQTRLINPFDATNDFQATANTNLPAPCNAFYTSAGGGSVNFFAESQCTNSAFSTIIVHEMGHWLNDRYNSGNGSDGFGEGNADVFAMYLLDTPVTGRGFFGPGTMGRTGDNTRQFCGDSNPGCYGGVHADGEVLMGALWKVRRNLKLSHGVSGGGLIADTLFNTWMNAYNDGQIRSIIETHWLILDDDDGDLSNGTPHYADIDSAFREQGFPGVDVSCPGASSFCVLSPNSAGAGAALSSAGSASVAANDLLLSVSAAPGNKAGLFFYGSQAIQAPFGDGTRCAGGSVFRLYPLSFTDATGSVARPLDLSAPPAASGPGEIQSGSTWHFQYWFRDPMGPGGSGFNFTDGQRVTFCP